MLALPLILWIRVVLFAFASCKERLETPNKQLVIAKFAGKKSTVRKRNFTVAADCLTRIKKSFTNCSLFWERFDVEISLRIKNLSLFTVDLFLFLESIRWEKRSKRIRGRFLGRTFKVSFSTNNLITFV